jgi:hypothetical protein
LHLAGPPFFAGLAAAIDFAQSLKVNLNSES